MDDEIRDIGPRTNTMWSVVCGTRAVLAWEAQERGRFVAERYCKYVPYISGPPSGY